MEICDEEILSFFDDEDKSLENRDKIEARYNNDIRFKKFVDDRFQLLTDIAQSEIDIFRNMSKIPQYSSSLESNYISTRPHSKQRIGYISYFKINEDEIYEDLTVNNPLYREDENIVALLNNFKWEDYSMQFECQVSNENLVEINYSYLKQSLSTFALSFVIYEYDEQNKRYFRILKSSHLEGNISLTNISNCAENSYIKFFINLNCNQNEILYNNYSSQGQVVEPGVDLCPDLQQSINENLIFYKTTLAC